MVTDELDIHFHGGANHTRIVGQVEQGGRSNRKKNTVNLIDGEVTNANMGMFPNRHLRKQVENILQLFWVRF